MTHIDRASHRAIVASFSTRSQRYYVAAKIATDPVYAATAAIIAGSNLPLLDIGCGIGLLGQYLHACGHVQPYLGLDHDERKIDSGRRAVRRAGLDAVMTLRHADAAELPASMGHVALHDILHYLSADRQLILLQTATRHLAPQGCLIIRNVLRESNWRFHTTRLEEFFVRLSGWIPGGPQHYPSAAELRAPLESAGLEVQVEPLHGRTPFNGYLIVARAHHP